MNRNAEEYLTDDEEFFVELIPDGQYISTYKKCEGIYASEHANYNRTAGSFDIRMLHEYISEDVIQERAPGGSVQMNGVKSTGRERLDDLIAAAEIINERKFQFSERQQKVLYDTYFVASLQKILGDELSANIDYVMKKFEFDELFEDVIIMMQRRGGKSVVTSSYISSFQISQVSANVNTYGRSKRVTKMLKELVKEQYFVLKDSKRFEPTSIIEDNDERFSIQTRYGTINTCNFYPCNAEVHLYPFLFYFIVKFVTGCVGLKVVLLCVFLCVFRRRPPFFLRWVAASSLFILYDNDKQEDGRASCETKTEFHTHFEPSRTGKNRRD